MRDILDKITSGLERPTDDDLQMAMDEIITLQGKPLPASQGVKFHLSEDAATRALQARIWAYSYVTRRRNLGVVNCTPEQITAYQAQERIDHDRLTSKILMGSSSIYAGISLSAPETFNTAVIDWLKGVFAKSEKQNALLIGGVGSGKTFGAVAYIASKARILDPNRIDAEFLTAYKLSELLSRRAFERLDAIEKIKNLVVDDLGTLAEDTYKSKDFIAYFENLFSTRHQHGRRTVITSNLSGDRLKEVFGERFYSRFKETGLVFVTGDGDYRHYFKEREREADASIK